MTLLLNGQMQLNLHRQEGDFEQTCWRKTGLFLIFLSFLCPCTLEYLMLVNEGNSECFRVTSVYRKQSRLAICSCLDREDSNGFFYGFEFLK